MGKFAKFTSSIMKGVVYMKPLTIKVVTLEIVRGMCKALTKD